MIKKILVSQPKPTSEKSPYYDIAERFGVELVFRPFIKVEGISSREFRTQKVSILDYTAIVFTSRHAIDHFFTLAKELRVNIPEDMKYFCVTETIALYIQKYVQYRKRKVFFGTTGKIDDLLPTMVKHKTEKFLVPQSLFLMFVYCIYPRLLIHELVIIEYYARVLAVLHCLSCGACVVVILL